MVAPRASARLQQYTEMPGSEVDVWVGVVLARDMTSARVNLHLSMHLRATALNCSNGSNILYG